MKNRLILMMTAIVLINTVAIGSIAHAAYTDLADYQTDLRKAKDDKKAVMEIHLRYLRDVSAKALAENNDMLWVGLKEKLNNAIQDYGAFRDGGASMEDRQRIGTELERLRKEILDGPEKVKKALLNLPAPKDVYKGKDKDAIKAKIKAKWKERYPDEEIVAIRFDNENWKRVKEKRWIENGGYWQNVDVSTLTVRVIVKKDAETATIYGIYVQRDNDNPGQGAEVGQKGTFAPQDILLANVK